MNPAEHILQSFFWHAESKKKPEGRRYLTICNFIATNGCEMDLVAMSGNGKDKLHVECHVDVGWPTSESYSGFLKDCIRKKFIDNEHCRRAISEQLEWDDSYRKVLVVWQNPFDNNALRNELYDQTVEVWSITDVLCDLLYSIGNSNFQDDILRTIAMISSMLSMGASLRNKGCKPVSPSVNELTAVDCIDAVATLSRKHATDWGQKTIKDKHVEAALRDIYDLAGEVFPGRHKDNNI